MKKPTPVRLVFEPKEAQELLELIKWAKGQTYFRLTDTAVRSGTGTALRLAARKLEVATCQPDYLAN